MYLEYYKCDIEDYIGMDLEDSVIHRERLNQVDSVIHRERLNQVAGVIVFA